MSDWTPKVGDKVMVGEHGPYEVRVVDEHHKTAALLLHGLDDPVLVTVGTALWAWLTPAPEPEPDEPDEPDEPTAPSALVRDGLGGLWCFNPIKARGPKSPDWDLVGQDISRDWTRIPRPITVVLRDPAEVETLRGQLIRVAEEAKRFHEQRDEARRERDELQRRIDRAQEYLEGRDALTVARRALRLILGEA